MREQFESRCRHLYHESVLEETCDMRFMNSSSVTAKELEDMFPTLDSSLIQVLRAEAPSAQQAIDILLALVASVQDVNTGLAVPTRSLPSRERLGVDDHEKFPSLVDADGWQILCPMLGQVSEGGLGSAWRDLALTAADKPELKRKPQQPRPNARRPPVQGKKHAEGDAIQPMSEFEARQRDGERRYQNRKQYGGQDRRRSLCASTYAAKSKSGRDGRALASDKLCTAQA